MADKAIEVLLDKKEIFRRRKSSRSRPTQEAQAFLIRRARIPKRFGESRQGAGLVQALEEGAGMELSLAKWFIGGKINVFYNCRNGMSKE